MNFENNESDFLVEDSSFDLKSIFKKLVQNWLIILISIFVSMVIGWVYTKTSDPLYRVESLFFIKEQENPLAFFGSPGIIESAGMGLQNETIILKSKPVAFEVLKKLDFQVEYYKEGSFVDAEIYQSKPIVVEVDWKQAQAIDGLLKIEWENNTDYTITYIDESYNKLLPDGSKVAMAIKPEPIKYKFNQLLSNNELTIKVLKLTPDMEGSILVKLRDLNSLSRRYSNALKIEPVERGASIMLMSVSSPNLQKGEVYLNSLMQTFLDMELEQKNQSASQTIDFIDSQVAGAADSLRYFENQLEDFRSSNKIYDLSSESSSVFERLIEYENQLLEEKFKRKYYQDLKDYLTSESYQEVVVPSGIGITDPFLNGLIENLLELQADKSRMLASQSEASPVVKEVNRKISDLNLSIRENLKNVDLNSNSVISDLEQRIAEIEKSFASLPQTEQSLIRIQREFALTENIYNYLMERRAEAAISKASNEANNKIVELAQGEYRSALLQ